MQKNKIAVFIDYNLRLPNYMEAYNIFLNDLRNLKNLDVENPDLNVPKSYWNKQLKNERICKFYNIEKHDILDTINKEFVVEEVTGEDFDLKDKKKLRALFYNSKHLEKFLGEYSYNIYASAEKVNNLVIPYLNLTNSFAEVHLVDEYVSNRKINNTLFFLAKQNIFFSSLKFIKDNKFNKEEYLDVWYGRTKSQSIDSSPGGAKKFINWLKKLEKQCQEQ